MKFNYDVFLNSLTFNLNKFNIKNYMKLNLDSITKIFPNFHN